MSVLQRSVVVTGASGFIGRALTPVLATLGWQLREVGRLPYGAPNPNAQTIECNALPLETLVEGCEVVIHLAGRAHVMKEHETDPLKAYRDGNVNQTVDLAQAARRAGVRRFVFISTAKVQGEGEGEGQCVRRIDAHAPYYDVSRTRMPPLAYSEADAPNPQDFYALSKWEAEQALATIARESKMEVVIIRPPLVYGPGVKGNFKSMVSWVKRGIPMPLGAINNRRSMVALENLVDFIALCADQTRSPRAANETFLISDTQDVSTTALLEKIAAAYKRPSRLIPLPEGMIRALGTLIGQGAAIDRLLCSFRVSAEKAQSTLGWRPVITMDEQLKKMALHDSAV
jgi:nucleoside-diphosphate-sugar epimerase